VGKCGRVVYSNTSYVVTVYPQVDALKSRDSVFDPGSAMLSERLSLCMPRVTCLLQAVCGLQ
jgi:hypothetical protein